MKSLITIMIVFLSFKTETATWKKLNSTIISTVTPEVTTCPTGYIGVPSNAEYSVRYFCVMKYEAKNDGFGMPASTTTSTPWVTMDRPTSRATCQALGAGYDMISNEQWQTIARNIAGVAANWNNGIVGNAQLNRGHSDSAPGSALAASTDADACSGTGQTCSNTVWNSQRRTHVLSNGNVIWDFAGNVWEWVTNNNTATTGDTNYVSALSGVSQIKYGAAAGTLCITTGSSPWCGMGYGYMTGANGAVVRGGNYNYGGGVGEAVGVFTVYLGWSITDTSFGFRCVFVP